jgi:hypothetical protein
MPAQRTMFIGDVHGCLAELDALLLVLAPREGDRFCFLGDLVDRGPDSVGVVRRVRELLARYSGSVCISGNHEEKTLRYREKGRALRAWAAGASDEDWAFLASLPLVHRVEDLGVVMVHGGFFPRFFEHHGALGEVPGTWRTDRGKRGDRLRRFLRIRSVDEAGDMVTAGEESPNTEHWSTRYDGREGYCFFGHDPQLYPAKPLRTPHAMGLDTGCCFGGALTAAVIAKGNAPREAEVVSVPGTKYAEPRERWEE